MKKSNFFGRHSLLILIVAVFVLPATLAGARRAFLSNKNEVQDWLPARYEETREFRWFQQHFAGEQFVLISWQGCTLDDQRLKLLVSKLVPRPGSPVPRDEQYFQSAVTGPMLLDLLTNEPLNVPYKEAVDRLKGSLIGPDGTQTCAVFVLSEAGKKSLKKTLAALTSVATGQCNIPLASIHMGGPPVDNVAIDTAGEKSLLRLAGISLVIGVGISWMCLRSGRLTAMVFATGIYSAALSLAIVWYTGTNMNAILLTMPPLVYVAAISGAIHLSNYYRDSVFEEGLDGAAGRSLRHAALPLGLATGTTAIGLISLCYSELVPIQLFGIYSAVGVVASLLLLCFFLPACFQLFSVKNAPLTAEHVLPETFESAEPRGPARFWWAVARFIVDRHNLVTALGIGALIFFGWGMTKITTSVQLMRMFSKGAPILDDYRWLEQHLGELVPMEIVLKIDPEECPLNFLQRLELVGRVQKELETIPEVGSALSATMFAPRLPQKEDFKRGRGLVGAFGRIAIKNQYEIARAQYAKRVELHQDEFFDQGYIAHEKVLKDGQLVPTDEQLWRVSARVGALKDVDYGAFVEEIRAKVEPVIHGIPGIQAVYTGLVPLIYKSQRSLLDGLLFGFVMDLVVVTIVMTLAVREWSAGIVLMLPSIFPVFIVFGVMGWAGIIVDTGTVMAPGVALGVTVDDVVHFMLMYRGGLKQGLSRRDSIMLAYKGCARAMYQSWGVMGLGLSVFAFSPFTPTQRFGYLMVTLLSSALIGNLVVLPAVLASPLGALFGRRFQRPALSPEQQGAYSSHLAEPLGSPLARTLRDEPLASEIARQ